MRRWKHPAFAAGCGQLIMVRRKTYDSVGGHGVIKPACMTVLSFRLLFETAGYRTDIFDATTLATCRMYRNAREVWSGLAKNATEGLAAPVRILPITAMLLCGQVLPFLLLAVEVRDTAVYAAAAALLPRVIAVLRFQQSLISAVLHPVGIFVLLILQWYALVRSLFRRPAVWKGRGYVAAASIR
jgi:hypothetical protein